MSQQPFGCRSHNYLKCIPAINCFPVNTLQCNGDQHKKLLSSILMQGSIFAGCNYCKMFCSISWQMMIKMIKQLDFLKAMRLSLKLLFFHFARDDKDIVRCPFHAILPQHKISKGIMGQKEAEAFCG